MNAALCWACVDKWANDNPYMVSTKLSLQERIRQGRCAFNEDPRGKPTHHNGKRVWEPKSWCPYALEHTVLEDEK
jgi:hypothetical protein